VTPDEARALGKRSGAARQKLTLDRVTAELPPMDSVEHVKARLEMICNWSVAGLVAGSQAGAAVRACEQWLKVHAWALDVARVRQLEARVRELEGQLERPRRGGAR
jgi:hypothetical protein